MNPPRSRPNIVVTPLGGEARHDDVPDDGPDDVSARRGDRRTQLPDRDSEPAPTADRRQKRRRRPSYYVLVAVGGIGRTMITVGILLMLFVAYQLWGTGWHESRAQSSLHDEFQALLSTTTTAPTTAPAPSPTTTALEATPPPTTQAPVEALGPFANGDAIARLRIPKIDVDKVVIEGVQVEDLRKGPGHYRSTPYPGQKGNAAIAGHRTTYGAPFNRIDELAPGDEIVVTTLQGEFTYTVLPQTNPDDGSIIGHLIVDPADVWVLDDAGDNRLTLTACHPKYSAKERIVVQARLNEPPAPTPPVTGTDAPGTTVDDPAGDDPAVRQGAADLDEGLGGDRDQLRPSILWGALLAAIFVASGIVTKRFGRMRSWGLALAPVAIVTFVFFEHLDRLLPAR